MRIPVAGNADEIRNLNLATSAGQDMSGYLKYFTERPLRRGRDDPLLEWRLHTHSLRFEPLHPGHARNHSPIDSRGRTRRRAGGSTA